MNQMTDYSHLEALELRLSHERNYLANAKNEKERNFRLHTIAMAEKEIAGEMKFLGIEQVKFDDISDDELLAELLK
jgi:hypothetical protein